MPDDTSDEPSPFDEIIDDTEDVQLARNWAYSVMRDEQRSPEWVATELNLESTGWSADDSATIAEDARRKTRHLRGVFTHEDAAEASESAYRCDRTMTFGTGFVPNPMAFLPEADASEPTGSSSEPGAIQFESVVSKRDRVRALRGRAFLNLFLGCILCVTGMALYEGLSRSSSAFDFHEIEMYLIAGGAVLAGLGFFSSGLRYFMTPFRWF